MRYITFTKGTLIRPFFFRLKASPGETNGELEINEPKFLMASPDYYYAEFQYYPLSEPHCPFATLDADGRICRIPCARQNICLAWRIRRLNQGFLDSYEDGRIWAQQLITNSRNTPELEIFKTKFLFAQGRFFERHVRELFLFRIIQTAEIEKTPCIHQCENINFSIFEELEYYVPRMGFWQAVSNTLKEENFSSGNGSP
uniref:Uncharacterized protein n=1 Tax=Lobelia patula TaxID=2041133 RepID=A0A291EZK6_9ASTR|nr:hypothetical protein Lo_pat1Pt0017 [Lobelia patula]ATG25295.1 hypothetical protein Lo_pat1Pt0017 [Lobelia patula]